MGAADRSRRHGSVWCAALRSRPHPRATSSPPTPTGEFARGSPGAIAEKSRTIPAAIHITETLNKLKKVRRELSQETEAPPPSLSELRCRWSLPGKE